MFGIVLTSAVTLMHIYVFWRAGSVPLLESCISRKVLIGTGLILWAIFYAGRRFGHGGAGTIAGTLEFLGMNWMAALFLIFVSLLATDLATGFGFLFPRQAPLLRGLGLVAGIGLSLIALVQGLRPPVVQNHEVYLADLPDGWDGKVLVAVSDLHLGTLLGAEWLAARVAQVQTQQPDLVVLLGDIFEGHGRPQQEFVPILRRLSAPYGVWAVRGNHDRSDGSTAALAEAGIQVLRNTWTEVHPGLVLVGVDDRTVGRRPTQNGDLIAQLLAERPPGAAIYLSHKPWHADRAARAGVGLMLCGHTHGGQIWPFGYLIRHLYPLFAGRYEVDGMAVIVCRGTGTWGPRMRLWRPGEILRVTLRKSKRCPGITQITGETNVTGNTVKRKWPGSPPRYRSEYPLDLCTAERFGIDGRQVRLRPRTVRGL